MSFVVFVHVCGSVTSSLLFGYIFIQINFHNLASLAGLVFLYSGRFLKFTKYMCVCVYLYSSYCYLHQGLGA